MTDRSVSVIIPARDAAGTLPTALEALRSQGCEYELVVVDDGSADATASIAVAAGANLVRTPGRGPASARNAGAAAAGGDLLAFLDADCRPAPGWLRAGREALENADFVQGRTLPDPESQPGPFDRTLSVTHASGLYESANLFISRALFSDLGGFESWLGPAGGKELGEDVWFGWRARRAGARMAFCNGALVYHAVFPGRAVDYVRARARLCFFPRLVARIPELRKASCYRFYFLNRRSAAFDAAIAGMAVASVTRTRWPLLAMAPYAQVAVSRAARWGRRRTPAVLAVHIAGDAVGFVALVAGSMRSRTPLL